MTRAVRPPAVAGSFYPADADELRSQVDALLAAARPDEGRAPKALVAPHAAYVYSGAVAASAYASVEQGVHRVVLLGPAHYVPIQGLALPGVTAMRTPLGELALDEEVCKILPGVRANPAAHAPEHSLEVHLPFLQRRLGAVSIVPLLVGDATAEEVAEVLEAAWGGADTLVIVSTDLSHYLPYRAAQARDERTAARIESLSPVEDDDACGARPLNGLLAIARARKMQVRRLDLRNSADSAGDRSRVVGYGAFAFAEGSA
jgi:MEMO1 family protein